MIAWGMLAAVGVATLYMGTHGAQFPLMALDVVIVCALLRCAVASSIDNGPLRCRMCGKDDNRHLCPEVPS